MPGLWKRLAFVQLRRTAHRHLEEAGCKFSSKWSGCHAFVLVSGALFPSRAEKWKCNSRACDTVQAADRCSQNRRPELTVTIDRNPACWEEFRQTGPILRGT